MMRPGHDESLLRLFYTKFAAGQADECWPWQGTRFRGYGYLHCRGYGNGRVYAHRLAYEVHVGPIPDGMEIDRICRNHACVNPAHLRLASHAENQQNRSPHGNRGSTSRYRGVSWRKDRKKWRAGGKLNSHETHLGYFDDEDAAARAASEWRAEHMPFSDDVPKGRVA